MRLAEEGLVEMEWVDRSRGKKRWLRKNSGCKRGTRRMTVFVSYAQRVALTRALIQVGESAVM